MDIEFKNGSLESIFTEYALKRKDFPFYTSGMVDAKLIYKVIFENTRNSLSIIIDEKDLDLIINDNELRSLLFKISNNVDVEVLLNNFNDTNTTNISKLTSGNHNIKTIKITTEKVQDLVIADKSMTRIESNPDRLGAFVNFNDSKFISQLINKFNSIFKSSKELSLS